MGTNVFHDRRDLKHLPVSEDYSRPLNRATILEANKRFRETGVPGCVPDANREIAARIVKEVNRKKLNSVKNSGQTVGEYLEYLNEIANASD